ncbi:hypothetical protein [Streptomyces sp. NPDC001435]|uniref:hypothetical protein n=1 Tax=unclassified Streptomyces TaxID=2593676 RepID=UPI0036C81596
MRRYQIAILPAALIVIACAGCGDDKPPHGSAALKEACGAVLDSTTIKEAQRSENFSRLYDATASADSHSSAAKTLLTKDHAAYVCQIALDDDPTPGSAGLSIKFTPGQGRLFSEEQKYSMTSYKAYKLGSGMQATTEAGSADVYFPCKLEDEDTPLYVTGNIYNDLDLSVQSRFRVLFRSSLKMAKLLKCENKISFPSTESMKPLPLDKG